MRRWTVFTLAMSCLWVAAAAAQAPLTYNVGAAPQVIVAADFDDDGCSDLAVANSGSKTVSVLLGNGDGTLKAALTTAIPHSPHAVLTGRVNGGASTDLITVDGHGANVLLGNGDGTFQPPIDVVLPPQSPLGTPLFQSPGAAAIGDLDGNGTLDLVAAGTTTIPDYYFYSGYYGTFSLPRIDGHLDVLLGKGDGTLGAATVEHVGEGRVISDLALGDFDGDGRVDVVTDGPDVRLGNGDGTFQAARQSPGLVFPYGVARFLSRTPVADFDRDGNLDLLVMEATTALVLLGNGDGTFRRGDVAPLGDPENMDSTAVGDVDADGNPDVVIVGGATHHADCNSTRFAFALLGYGNGAFGASSIADWALGPVIGNSLLISSMLTDLDGDGFPELAVADSYRGTVTVAKNGGAWPVPTPTIRIDDVSVSEGDTGTSAAVFTVRLLAPYHEDVTVDYATAMMGWTGQAADIVAASGSIRIAAGETSRSVTVEVLGDRRVEIAEEFGVVLSNASPNASIFDNTGRGTILDDDPPVGLHVSDVTRREGRSGRKRFDFTVTLSSASVDPVIVQFGTLPNTAKAADRRGRPSDFVSRSGSLVFAPGETTKTITVRVRGDRRKEADETFVLYVVPVPPSGEATPAIAADGEGLGTIVNDD